MNLRSMVAALVFAVVMVSGCSILPYEDTFACEGDGTYGKCVSVQGAYDEAVTGVPHGRVITKDGVSDEEDTAATTPARPIVHSQDGAYAEYREEEYRQLKELISQPDTPMVRKAEQRRTLILSYSPMNRKDRLYMPRYVYTIHRPAEFVMGQYLLDADPSIRAISDFLKRADTSSE